MNQIVLTPSYKETPTKTRHRPKVGAHTCWIQIQALPFKMLYSLPVPITWLEVLHCTGDLLALISLSLSVILVQHEGQQANKLSHIRVTVYVLISQMHCKNVMSKVQRRPNNSLCYPSYHFVICCATQRNCIHYRLLYRRSCFTQHHSFTPYHFYFLN